MLQLKNISQSYNHEQVLDNVSLSLANNRVTALVGANGAGKTTLLRLLLGEIRPDAGTVVSGGHVLGYVPQELEDTGRTIAEFIDGLEPWRIESALERVNLANIDYVARLATLSGGQKTRLAIAIVLAQDPEPSILLLDEPTNNLDADGIAWLERFIGEFDGGILVVSHDRTFINNVADTVIELEDAQLRIYGGNYNFYKEQKELELASAQAQYEDNQQERRRLKQAMQEQREKTKHAHEHIKRNDHDTYQRNYFRNRVSNKLGQNAKKLETQLDQLPTIGRPRIDKRYGFTLHGSVPNSKLILRLKNVDKSFDGSPVLQGVSLEIRGSERIHVQGPNGSGKSTLLKIAAGVIVADHGAVQFGVDVGVGYFSQDTNQIDYAKSALDNLLDGDAKLQDVYRQARNLGLNAATLKMMPKELSRGQQSKLAFAKLLLAGYQLIILDEPTNHLDIPTKEELEMALQQYEGALLVASHDTYFLKQININQTFVLSGS